MKPLVAFMPQLAPALTEAETQALLALVRAGDREAREQLVAGHLRLVASVAQRFLKRGREFEDIFQVGTIGLMKAIDKFDPSFAVCFSTYAVPMIMGEIRRYLRDDQAVHVSRSLKESGVKLMSVNEKLMHRLGREPTLSELMEAAQMTREEIVVAMDALAEPLSLQEYTFGEEDSPQRGDRLPDLNEGAEIWIERIAVQEALDKLKDKERRVLELRYFQEKTQAEAAALIGVSQAQVSRLEKGALLKLKRII